MKETELKPCPFCGGEAKLAISNQCMAKAYCVVCKDSHCRGRGRKLVRDIETAINAWNRRGEQTMSKEKQIDGADLAVLNCYRNKYYADGNSTEQGIVANAINAVLPILVSLKNEGCRKQSEGEWHYNPDGMDWGLGAWQCSVCGCRNDNLPMDEDIKPLAWAGTKYCPNCGAKMKGGAE